MNLQLDTNKPAPFAAAPFATARLAATPLAAPTRGTIAPPRRKTLLILSFTDHRNDPRVNRQIRLLNTSTK